MKKENWFMSDKKFQRVGYITLVIIMIIAILGYGVKFFIEYYNNEKECKNLGYDYANQIQGKYYNCCNYQLLIEDNKYIDERECIAKEMIGG